MESVLDYSIKMIRVLSKTENDKIRNFVNDVANFMDRYCKEGADTMNVSKDRNTNNNGDYDCEIVFMLRRHGFDGNYKISNRLEKLKIQKPVQGVVSIQYQNSIEEKKASAPKVDKSVSYDIESGVWCLKENDGMDFKFTLSGKTVKEVKEGTATAGGEGKM